MAGGLASCLGAPLHFILCSRRDLAECGGTKLLLLLSPSSLIQGGTQACFWKWLSHLGVGPGPQVSHLISDSSSSSPDIVITQVPLLRSSLLPAFYALPFFLVKFLHLDFSMSNYLKH